MIDIPDIQLKPLPPAQRVPPVDLGPARDPRLYFLPARLFRGIEIEVFHQQWPRTDQAHLARQHVPKLG